MKTGGNGGSHTKSGLHFEGKVDFLEMLKTVPGYTIRDDGSILYKNEIVAFNLRKNRLYSFLANKGVDFKKFLSKKLLPDDAIFVPEINTLYIIEIKFQQVAGSVDEKLQTCQFKKRQYERLVNNLGISVEYIYILNDWFRHPSYKDVLEHIKEVGCDYFFEEISLERIGLPS